MLRAPFALLWNLFKLLSYGVRALFFRLGHFLTRKKRKWVRLKLPKRLSFGPPAGLASYVQDKLSYIELRDNIDVLAGDPRIEGVVVTTDHLLHGPARIADLRALINRLRQRGKTVIFHTHSVHGRAYDLATGADEVLMTPGGRFYMFGQRFEQFFAAALLERLGVAAQFVHIGPFKGAAHRFIKTEAPPALRLMMNNLVDSLSELREERIRHRRGISEKTLASCFERMPLDDRQAHCFGLIDGRIHRRFIARWIEEGDEFVDAPQLARHTPKPDPPEGADVADVADAAEGADVDGGDAENAPPLPPDDDSAPTGDTDVSIKDATRYVESHPGPFRWTPLFKSRRRIAALDLSGMIVMPEMELPGHSLATIDPSEVLPALRKLAADNRVAAVVLHINSPGGSALASELIWDGIRRLRYDKPTIAYCSDVAASGGYYLAAAADRIVCQAETITGSIGVIAGKFSFPGTLDNLDVGTESFYRHETSLFESLTEPLSREVLENLRRDARAFYRQFLRRVGDARQLPHRRLHRYARGRIYTGADAERRFLVDHLGGFDDAVAIARSLVEPELPDDAPVAYHPHRQIGLSALIKQSTAASAPKLPESLQHTRLLHALVKQDPLLALMPYRLQNNPGGG